MNFCASAPCPVFGIAIVKTRLKPNSNTNQIIIFSGLMILLPQESYERSILLGASCKHVCSNITLLIWQQTNDRLTTFTVLMKINAGKRIWGSEGGASYEHKGYEFDWLPVYPFPINTFFTAVSIMVGHIMGGAVLLYWSWGLLLGGDSVILWAWDTLENLAENGSRTFLPCLQTGLVFGFD